MNILNQVMSIKIKAYDEINHIIFSKIKKFCNKHKLNFISTMGMIEFTNHNDKSLDTYTPSNRSKSKFLKEYWDLLDIIYEVHDLTRFDMEYYFKKEN